MMNRTLVYKVAAMVLLIVALLVALALIGGTIAERQRLRNQVVAEIAQSSSTAQTITGPVIVVPYRKRVKEWLDDRGNRLPVPLTDYLDGQLVFLPEMLTVDGKIRTESRARGIYTARLYHAENQISGHFDLPPQYGITEDYASYEFQEPRLAIGLSDVRGIETTPTLQLNGAAATFAPGTTIRMLGSGIHAPVPIADPSQAIRLNYLLTLRLQGTSELHVTPVGRESQVSLESDWPHPSFSGNLLPASRTVTSKGFSARWQTSFFATNLNEAVRECAKSERCQELQHRHFGVSFVDPVDQYLKSERAIKYALLFIALTFAGFFLYEVLRQLAVHPIQYGLVGAALAVFYLLLLSLSEHIGFNVAYAASATACVSLIGYYVGHVLQSLARGLGFAAGLAMLYGLLFCLLNAEDFALLMGAVMVFALLTVVMVLTRRVNWFALTSRQT